jgi:transmembrane sensor
VSPSDEQIRGAIAEQASEWYVENRSGPLDHKESARFMAWLQSSPMHVEEYLRVAALAPDLESAAKTDNTPRETLLARARGEPDGIASFDRAGLGELPALAGRRRSSVWSLAAAATLAVVAVTAVWSMRNGERFGLPRTYSTVRGEQRVQSLPDGSMLHLNTDSAVTVRYSRTERLVSLVHGQALFEVAHQDQRAFRVQTNRAGVVAVGTQFDVYRKSGTTTITVVEGSVEVYRGGAAPPAGGEPAVRLNPGDQLDVGDRIGALRHVDAHAAVAWLQRQIAFQDEPLGEVAAEFNRYGPISVEIDDASLRALPISGIVDAYDIDSFAAYLATLNGVIVQKTSTRIRVLTRASLEPQGAADIHTHTVISDISENCLIVRRITRNQLGIVPCRDAARFSGCQWLYPSALQQASCPSPSRMPWRARGSLNPLRATLYQHFFWR